LFKGACSLCLFICICLYILTCWFPALFHFLSIQFLTFDQERKHNIASHKTKPTEPGSHPDQPIKQLQQSNHSIIQPFPCTPTQVRTTTTRNKSNTVYPQGL
jgi:hypothetical protein